ncbi:autotransporter assembly complex protein TamA [Undibacterium sp. SXout7W]|uniref:autotransporter assembly complex protein TamA n=1 Tax=Undibacterium sp. SXout7W TaxID=3413049 RepID=UPI003BF2AD36
MRLEFNLPFHLPSSVLLSLFLLCIASGSHAEQVLKPSDASVLLFPSEVGSSRPASISGNSPLTPLSDTLAETSNSASDNNHPIAPAPAPAPAPSQLPASVPASIDDNEVQVSSISGRFQLQADKAHWSALLLEHIPEISSNADPQNITPGLIRKLRTDISGILATEGYFSPQITFQIPDTASEALITHSVKLVRIIVQPGQRSVIENVSINISGPLGIAVAAGDADANQLRHALQQDWGLPVGQAFREADWSDAKAQLLEALRSNTYAAANLNNSEANIDADHYRGILQLDIDSGPPFRLGDLHITGLQRYSPWLLQRYLPPAKGELYSRERLLDFQRALQNSPYFATVAVGIDPDPENAAAVPVDVTVVERKARDLSFGIGYSSNTGFRGEVAYRDRDIASQAWDLRSAIRIEQKRQLGYVDIYLPPRENHYLDSFGVLSERQNVSGVISNRNALGVKRTSTSGHLEQRLGLNITREKITVQGEAEEINKALVASIGWTWRDVDDAFAPRRGQILQLDIAASEKRLLSDQRFIRTYAKYQRWIPLGNTDSFILRAELGDVFSRSSTGIPEDYLFRTGGSTTVRGYSYQSLGIQHVDAVTGGRVMAVASAEYVHWLNADWGAAGFVDAGDAADAWRDLNIRQAVGIGARYRTPAGPIALDLAYGRQSKKLRLDFSIAIAF